MLEARQGIVTDEDKELSQEQAMKSHVTYLYDKSHNNNKSLRVIRNHKTLQDYYMQEACASKYFKLL